MILYDLFFRQHGVRLPQHLMTPVISTLDKFQFPRNSLYHYLTFDGIHSGPVSDEYIFRNITKPILMDHITALGDMLGSPRKINEPLMSYIREYHAKNRRYRYLKDLTKIPRDESTLMVLNYGFLPKLYRYTRNIYAEYYKWWNLEKSMFASMAEISKISSREQYFLTSLPKNLPSVGTLKAFSKQFNSTVVKVFNTPESLIILEIWKWLGTDYREASVFAGLDQQTLSKINIVYQESNSWIMFNLGVLNKWRHDPSEALDPLAKVSITPDQMQKRFLRCLMSLMSTRIVPIDPDAETDTEVKTLLETPEEIAEDEETRREKADRVLDEMEADLKELENIEQKTTAVYLEEKTIAPAGIVKISDFHTEETTESSVVAICDKLADDGLITASIYRNLVNSAKNYQTIKAPNQTQTLEEFIKIDPEIIIIKESPSIPDISTVTDKSMLKSSLLTFDEDYVDKVLAKDVASMVVNIQRAGVILTNYTVEKHEDILGNSEVHSIRVRPVEGVASTLHFKLPSVDSEGVITYNGNKYKLRKQRGDVPIRKIAPDTVALTSYYGKNFITRSPKKINNYSQWLCKQIMLKGLDGSDTDITQLATANVFDNLFSCPITYSTLAMQFKSFTAGSYSFNFDHTKRVSLYGQENLDKYEVDSMIIIGTDDKGNFIGIDNTDTLYELNDTSHVSRGTMESILNLEVNKAPVAFADIKIFGKAIPVGFILAYQLGLDKLMQMLQVEPRRVLAGQRLNLEVNEYAITFNDTSLIFNREDRLASMILAGLSEYTKALRKYNVESLNKQNVYLNLLEATGLGARYLREINLFNNLFIDPITKELLVEMKEPTTVRGLLVRSCELLLQDKHPDLLDLRYMRIKGYERLSGAVYSELVQSIRSHNAKAGKSGTPLEMHPYAVWKRVVQDPAMNMISDINPIENLKQTEAVTYSGSGGRSARSMTKATRVFHKTDTGVISESTVDSSHVGVNIFTSADPQFKSLRGTTKPYVIGESGATALLSTSALLSPGSDHDD